MIEVVPFERHHLADLEPDSLDRAALNAVDKDVFADINHGKSISAIRQGSSG